MRWLNKHIIRQPLETRLGYFVDFLPLIYFFHQHIEYPLKLDSVYRLSIYDISFIECVRWSMVKSAEFSLKSERRPILTNIGPILGGKTPETLKGCPQ